MHLSTRWLLRVLAALVAVLVAVAGCASGHVEPIGDATRRLCAPDVVAVRTPWDASLAAVFSRVREAVARESAGRPGRVVAEQVVVVTGPPVRRAGQYAYGWPCGPLVVVHINALTAANHTDEPEEFLARLVAHEMVHVLLRHEASDAPLVQSEYEAYLLGAYYVERAGFDCRRWEGQARERAGRLHEYAVADRSWIDVEARAVALGCDMAKRGQRPLRDVVAPR